MQSLSLPCLLTLCLFLVSCGDPGPTSLGIERDRRDLSSAKSFKDLVGKRETLENGMVRMRFLVPPNAFDSYTSSSGGAADPFADPKPPAQSNRREPKEALEDAGITFDEGSSALYDRKRELLTVVQTGDQMDLVEAYLDGGCGCYAQHLYIRAEVYELPVALAREALASVRLEGDHTPEYEAVVRKTDEGTGRMVGAVGCVSRSGQRTLVEDRMPSVKAEKGGETGNGKSGKATAGRALISLEVDPVLGADEKMIDLNLSFELAGAAPSADNAKGGGKTVLMQCVARDGEWLLAANWLVPETNRMQLFFVSVSVQHPHDHPEVLLCDESGSLP